MTWLLRVALRAPWRLLAFALLAAAVAGSVGANASKVLSAGGQQDPAAESSQVERVLDEQFGISGQQFVLVLRSESSARTPGVAAVANDVERQLRNSGFVENLTSAWALPEGSAQRLFSRDGKSGVIVAGLTGGEDNAPKHAKELIELIGAERDGVTIRAGGQAVLYNQITTQMQGDLFLMESIAIPVSFLALIWVFGGLYAALLPMSVGIFSILGSMAILRTLAVFTGVSVFALNLTVALGLALAIDYSLLLISRYREEIARGNFADDAIGIATRQSGRTIAFSALTIAVALAALLLFPMYFLKSFAYAGIGAVLFSAAATLVIVPAALRLLGPRIDRFDVRVFLRRYLPRRGGPSPTGITASFWYRNTKRVLRFSAPVAAVIVTGLLAVGMPFLQLKLGFPDDRVLPKSTSARQVGDALRADFPADFTTNLPVVLTPVENSATSALSKYASELSSIADVQGVSAPAGLYVRGTRVGPPRDAATIVSRTALLTVENSAAPGTDAAERLLAALHSVPPPTGSHMQLGGLAQTQHDNVHSVTSKIPLVLALMAASTFALLCVLTRSVVIPVKALVLNVLSLTATFGSLVWIFQQGHLHAAGTDPTGSIAVSTPILLFCVAFGLSMDYEVFLMARIREYWLKSARTRADNEESVALGVAQTGPTITAAALIMCISFAALTAAQVAFVRMFGLGLTLAVLLDATIIRMLLVPAFMHLLGTANWWSPRMPWTKPIITPAGPTRHPDAESACAATESAHAEATT